MPRNWSETAPARAQIPAPHEQPRAPPRPRIARIPRAARKHSSRLFAIQTPLPPHSPAGVPRPPRLFVLSRFTGKAHTVWDGASPPPKHQAREGNAQRERFFLSERDIRIGGRVSPPRSARASPPVWGKPGRQGIRCAPTPRIGKSRKNAEREQTPDTRHKFRPKAAQESKCITQGARHKHHDHRNHQLRRPTTII